MNNIYKPSKRFCSRITVIFFLFLYAHAVSQENSDYSLLWKIEGKNLTKPSYLFGTMHIDDARVFKFSDAVMPAIKSCEFFALEVHPDSIYTAIKNKVYEYDAETVLEDLLSKKEYERLLKRFEAINNYPLIGSGIKDVDYVTTLLRPNFDKDDDKSTFVDMYLLGQAKTMRRAIKGLEDPEDQANYFENLTKKEQREYVLSYIDSTPENQKKYIEEMTQIYARGNLKEIQAYIEEDLEDKSHYKMIERNKVMCKSIITYLQKGSLFSAVGTAHLPGKDGLIALLQDKGYKVTPVEAKFTGVADRYKVDISKMEWHLYTNDTLAYSVEVPGDNLMEEDFSNFIIYGYNESSENTNYSFMGWNTGFEFTKELSDKAMNKMTESILSNRKGTLQDKQVVEKDNSVIHNVRATLENGILIRSKLVFKNNAFYYFSAETKEEHINSASIERFFNSVKINEIKKETHKEAKWTEYTNEQGAFSLKVPSKPIDLSREYPNPFDESGDPYFLNLYSCIDSKNSNNYLFRYNDHPIGYYIEDLENTFTETNKTLLKKAKQISKPKVISHDGYPGREFELLLKEKYHCIVRVYLRGNRLYLLLKHKLNETEKVDVNDPFFTSFKFIPYKSTKLKEYIPEKANFKIKLLETVKIDIDTVSYETEAVMDSHDFFTKNNHSGGLFSFGYSNLRPYVKFKKDDDYLNAFRDEFVKWDDTIISQKNTSFRDSKTIEFIKRKKNDSSSLNVTKHKLWQKNKRIYMLSAYTSKEELNSSLTDSLFNSFKYTAPDEPFDAFTSKTKHILKDLKSNDTTTYKNAINSFGYYEFETTDLPQLHKALNQNYINDSTDVVRSTIIDQFSYVSDSTTLNVLNKLYTKSNTSQKVKAKIIATIPDIKSPNSLKLYRNLLLTDPPINKEDYHWKILQPYNDSLEYTIKNYKDLITLIEHKPYRKDIISLSSRILKSEYEDKNIVNQNYNALLKHAINDHKIYVETKDEDNYDYTNTSLLYTYLSLMNSNKSEHSVYNTFTNEILKNEDDWIALQAVTARIFNNLHVDKNVISKKIDTLYSRYEIMEAYHKIGELNNIPSNYLEPEEFAKLSLYNYIGEDDSYPDNINILDTVIKEDKTYYAISFSYNTEDNTEQKPYFGLVGPITQITQETEFARYKSYSNWDELSDNLNKQATELIPDLLEYGY